MVTENKRENGNAKVEINIEEMDEKERLNNVTNLVERYVSSKK